MKVLLLMWTETDASGGDEGDIAAWGEFDAEVRKAGAYIYGGALEPPAASVLIRPDIAAPDPATQTRDGTFAPGAAQIQAFYLLDVADPDDAQRWARRLPTYGTVEVRALLEYDLG
jgi:hypothetical protein